MPFNGVGVFQRVYQWVNDASNNIFVDATRTDQDSNDIADGLTNCITRDGQSTVLSNLPMGGNKLTGLGTGQNAGDSVNYGQVFNNPGYANGLTVTGGVVSMTGASSVTVPTVATTDSSNNAASTFYVNQKAFQSALPAQSAATFGMFPQSQGASGIVLWASAQSMMRSSRNANVALAVADKGSLIDITANTFTQTFAAAATLGAGWYVYLRNAGAGDITLDPNASELIDGLTSYIMYPGEVRLIQCNGTAFTSIILNDFTRVFTTTSTFVTPPGYANFEVDMWAGGQSGEGGGGNSQTSGAGGAGAAGVSILLPAAIVPSSLTVTVGAGGIGPAGSPSLVGPTAAVSGGSSSFGALYSVSGTVGTQGTYTQAGAGGARKSNGVGNIGSAALFAGAGGGSGGVGSNVSAAAGGSGGVSTLAGNGGDGGNSTTSTGLDGFDGSAPGGGGGGGGGGPSNTTSSGGKGGNGGRGEVRVRGRI